MEEARTTKVVQEAYAAFSRGDIQMLLSKFGQVTRFQEFCNSAAINAAYAA